MFDGVNVSIMRPGDAPDAIAIWKRQFAHFCGDSAVFSCWADHTVSVEEYISAKAGRGEALLARAGDRPAGFIAFDIFDFHGAESAVCHFCGNAVDMDCRKPAFQALYGALCEYCGKRGILNQYIAISANDLEVKDMLFDLSFGSYGVDAFARFDRPLSHASPYTVELAAVSDTQAVCGLYTQAESYFLQPPIHLRLPHCSGERIEEMIRKGTVYVARADDGIVGMMDLDIAEEDNIYRMYTKGCCVVCGELGAYIRKEYRGKGIGSHLIGVISEYCVRNHIPCAHVPWETFNPYANRFWRKFFTPAVLALKRTIHPDGCI